MTFELLDFDGVDINFVFYSIGLVVRVGDTQVDGLTDRLGTSAGTGTRCREPRVERSNPAVVTQLVRTFEMALPISSMSSDSAASTRTFSSFTLKVGTEFLTGGGDSGRVFRTSNLRKCA